MVVFFFPTCKFCNAAFPAVQRMYDAYKEQGLSMVWINAVPQEDRLVKGWQAKHGYTVPVLVGASMATLQRDYDLVMTPTLYLLNPQGEVLFRHAGYQPEDEQTIEQEIKKAIGVAD
jgi:hypothetical protein